jgi:hypothetical protein
MLFFTRLAYSFCFEMAIVLLATCIALLATRKVPVSHPLHDSLRIIRQSDVFLSRTSIYPAKQIASALCGLCEKTAALFKKMR